MNWMMAIKILGCLVTIHGNPAERLSSSETTDDSLLNPLTMDCPLMDCEVMEEFLDCPPSERTLAIIRVDGHNCSGCPTCPPLQPAPVGVVGDMISDLANGTVTPSSNKDTMEGDFPSNKTGQVKTPDEELMENRTNPTDKDERVGQTAADESIRQAVQVLNEWSKGSRLGTILNRLLGVPFLPFNHGDAQPGNFRPRGAQPSRDFVEEDFRPGVACPLLDCGVIEEAMACPESQREGTIVATINGVACEGCRRCQPDLEDLAPPPSPPISRVFPLGGCPLFDCDLTESLLTCPASQREVDFYKSPTGQRCPGCLRCKITPEGNPGGSVKVNGSEDSTPSRDPDDVPPTDYQCPHVECHEVEAGLDCTAEQREIFYFELPDGRRCPGCRHCSGPGPEGADLLDREPPSLPRPPDAECPVTDCEIIEQYLTCSEEDRETRYIETSHGLRCPGCRECINKSENTEGPSDDIEGTVREGKPHNGQEAGHLGSNGTRNRTEGVPSTGENPAGEDSRCPLLDCEEVEENLPCPTAARRTEYFELYPGVQCPVCRRCSSVQENSEVATEWESVPPADHGGLPIPSQGEKCPLIDCSETEAQLPCPTNLRQTKFFRTLSGVLCPSCHECRPPVEPVPPSSSGASPLPRGCPLLDCEALEVGLPCPPHQRKWTTYRIGSGQVCPGCKRCIR